MRNLEVIALNKKDILELNGSEIDRIELCVDINKDGLTMTLEETIECLKCSQKPIRLMVRDSNSFFINNDLENMKEYIKNIKKENLESLEGFVFGYITNEEKPDYLVMEELIKTAKPLKVTLHKASDFFINNETEFKKMLDLGIDTVLTQGGKTKIMGNIEVLKKYSNSSFELLLGGGINKDNIDDLLKLNTSIHLGSYARINNSYNNSFDLKLLEIIKNKMK